LTKLEIEVRETGKQKIKTIEKRALWAPKDILTKIEIEVRETGFQLLINFIGSYDNLYEE